MSTLGYWTAADAPQSHNTLIYIVAHQSREAAKKSWDAFRADPVLVPMREATKREGPSVAEVYWSSSTRPTSRPSNRRSLDRRRPYLGCPRASSYTIRASRSTRSGSFG